MTAQHVGREAILNQLQNLVLTPPASLPQRPFAVCIYGAAGTGKGTLLFELHRRLAAVDPRYGGVDSVVHWRWSNDMGISDISGFLSESIATIGGSKAPVGSNDFERVRLLNDLLDEHPSLLVMEGFNAQPAAGEAEVVLESPLQNLVETVARRGLNRGGLIIIGSTKPLRGLDAFVYGQNLALPQLSVDEAETLLRESGAEGDSAALRSVARLHDYFPLSLALVGQELKRGRITLSDAQAGRKIPAHGRLQDIYRWYDDAYPENSPERTALYVLSLFRRPVSLMEIERALQVMGNQDGLAQLRTVDWGKTCLDLEDRGFVVRTNQINWTYSFSPWVLREHTAAIFQDKHPTVFQDCHSVLAELRDSEYQKVKSPGLSELEPVYDRVFHLCMAGRWQDALHVYWTELCLERQFYTQQRLGAFLNDLDLVSLFFDNTWQLRSDVRLETWDVAWLKSCAAYLLNTLGHLPIAESLRQEEVDIHRNLKFHALAAQDLGHLALNRLYQGKITEASQALDQAERELRLAKADELDPSNKGICRSSPYVKNLNLNQARGHVAARSALISYFTGSEDKQTAEAFRAIDTGLLGPTSGFIVCIVLLDGLGKFDQTSVDPIFQKTKEFAENYARKAQMSTRADVQANGLVVDALLQWRQSASATTVAQSLKVACSRIEQSGRIDIVPMLYCVVLRIALTIVETEFCEAEDHLGVSDVAQKCVDGLENALRLHQADLFEIEAQLLKIRFLLVLDLVSDAREELNALCASDSRVQRYWEPAIRELQRCINQAGRR
jgi:hypothetical protein